MSTKPAPGRNSRIRTLEGMATRLRRHVVEMTSAAGSGHLTTSLSAADLVAALFFHALRYDVKHPADPRNDRVVLSKGHGAPILYAAWAEAGAFDPDRLTTLRRFDSDLEGHPTPRLPWVEIATGSLGQGLSAGVGLAIAATLDGSPARTWVVLGDGETMEGSVWEAAALAAHRRLERLVAIVDVNRLGQSEETMVGHDLGPYVRRFEAFGWRTIAIDGHDLGAIADALDEASAGDGRPTAIVARTLKGKGVSFVENRDGWHGKALDPEDEMPRALAEIGEPPPGEPPPVARPGDAGIPPLPTGAPDVARLAPPAYAPGEEVATRDGYGEALWKLGELDPRIVALDGDVKNSTRAEAALEAWPERFVECFIAEQNMVGVATGLAARGRIPFVSSFACFLTRAFDQIRMAAISRANLKLCGSHAGVSIGEDGPSQMGLEDLAMMRAIPGSVVLYPSDAVSAERLTAAAAAHDGITYLRTTRPKTPVLYGPGEAFPIGGSKVLRAGSEDRVTVVAAGITVHEALRAARSLREEGLPVRVVDLYSVKPVDAESLREAAAATSGLVLVVEDHYPEGGLTEAVRSALAGTGAMVESLAVRELPRSGDGRTLLEAYGIDAGAIARAVRRLAMPEIVASPVGWHPGEAGL